MTDYEKPSQRTNDNYPWYLPQHLRSSYDYYRNRFQSKTYALTTRQYLQDLLAGRWHDAEMRIRDEFESGDRLPLWHLKKHLRDDIEALDWIYREEVLHARAQAVADATAHWARPEIAELSRRKTKARPRPTRSQTSLKNAHKMLDVWPGDDYEVVKAAWRQECLKHHPDHGGHERKFLSIQWAWDRLRAEYGWP